MDWAIFLETNSQSLFTLGGVFLGSLITFFISYLNNRFQSKERDKDREEKRKEAQIQTKEKWIERDILKIMDYLDIMLKLYSEIRFLQLKNDSTLKAVKRAPSTPEEFIAELERISQMEVIAPLTPEGLINLKEVISPEELKLKATEELILKAKGNRERITEAQNEINQIVDMMSRLVYSFEEDDILSAYKEFTISVLEFERKQLNVNENLEIVEITPLEKAQSFFPVKYNAGKFQRALRNKLISIRDN